MVLEPILSYNKGLEDWLTFGGRHRIVGCTLAKVRVGRSIRLARSKFLFYFRYL